MSTFRERLRMARRVRDITQEQLAEMAEISRAMVGRYESSDQLPALDTLVRIADALGVSTDYLLGRTEAMDAAFPGQYVAPERPPCVDRMPKNPAELADFIRYTVAQMQKEGQPDSR